MGFATAEARELPLFDGRNVALKKSGQNNRSQLGQAIPESRLDGLEIRPAGFAPLGEDTGEQRCYFARHLLMDCSSRFVSWVVQPTCVCWAGRSAQIFSLRAMSSWLSTWKR